MKQIFRKIVAALAVGATLAGSAAAQDFPTRAMQFVVPFPPGGGNDLVSRIVSDGLSKKLGQPVVVLNRPGQANSVAGEIVASSAPDGHTFMLAGPAFATNPFLYTDLPFDVTKLESVALLTVQPYVLTVNAEVEAKTLEQFVELLRTSPQGYDFATYGWGSVPELNMLSLGLATEAELTGIPYTGGSQATASLLSGETKALFSTIIAAKPHIASGMVRPMAIASPQRSPQLPDVPTFSELGYDIISQSFYGISVPAGTPAGIKKRLADAVIEVLNDPATRQQIEKQGSEVIAGDGAALDAFLKDQRARISVTIERSGIVARKLSEAN